MELTPRISGRCQLILIPGERRRLKLRGVGFKNLAFELFADDTVMEIPVETVSTEGEVAEIAIAVPTDIKTELPWYGRIRDGDRVFCEFEVKFLDAVVAASLGWV